MKHLTIQRDITRKGSLYEVHEVDDDGIAEVIDSGIIRFDNEKDVEKYDAMYAEADEVYEVDSLASNSGSTQIKFKGVQE